MTPPKVMALVLTFDAPESLRSCLHALQVQRIAPDDILVIDNASEPPAVRDAIASVQVERMSENLGPAGGHAQGLTRFLESDADLAWVLDDDICPEPECLAAQLEAAAAQPRSLVFPHQLGPDGTPDDYPRWAGVLIPRAAVAEAGVPIAELFWWIEDTEYLADRLPRAGFPIVRASGATVRHSATRRIARKPDWKIYYETRNTVYYRIWIQHGRRAWKIVRYLGRVTYRILQQAPPRGARLRMVGRGVMDGLRKRLGKPIDPPR